MYLRDIGFILKKHGLSHGITKITIRTTTNLQAYIDNSKKVILVLAYNASAMKNFLLLAYLPSWSPQ